MVWPSLLDVLEASISSAYSICAFVDPGCSLEDVAITLREGWIKELLEGEDGSGCEWELDTILPRGNSRLI